MISLVFQDYRLHIGSQYGRALVYRGMQYPNSSENPAALLNYLNLVYGRTTITSDIGLFLTLWGLEFLLKL